MARRDRFINALGLTVAGVMLMAACGGGEGNSRARNSAFEFVQDCFSSQELKDAEVGRLTAQRDRAAVAETDLERLNTEMTTRADEATAKWAEFQALPAVARGNSVSDEEWADVERVGEEYDAALAAAKAASAAYAEAKSLVASKDLIAGQLAVAESKLVCVQTVDNSTDAPSTSTASSTATESDDETSTEAPTTSTGDVGSSGDGNDDSPPTTNVQEFADCGLPIPREGRDFTVDRGGALAFTFDLCGPSTAIAVRSDNWPDTEIQQYFNEDGVVVHTIRFPNAGTARLGFLGYNQPTDRLVTEPAFVTVTVRESSANDPCAGKSPDASWNADLDGGTFVGTSTCDGIDTLWVSVSRLTDDALTQVFRGYIASAAAQTDLIQIFGPGTYEVQLKHVTRQSDDDEWEFVGDATALDVTYVAPEPETVSNGAVETPVLRDGTVTLPVFALDPSAPEAPTNPRDTDARVPVVAVPSDAPVITCDQACIDGLIDRVGATEGTVEISFGTADFQTVTSASSFASPVEATSVRVRVTPADGDPVTMAAVLTRDSVDEAYAEAAMGEVKTGEVDVSDGGTSSLWWIIALVVVLLTAAEAERRRRKAKTAQPVA